LADDDAIPPPFPCSIYSAYALQEAAQRDASVWVNTDHKVAALEPGFKLEVIFV
jgi:hypothetical protein